jgi:hypothetical protein
MSKTQTTESSPVNVEDLFYSNEDTPQPDSTTGHEGDTSSSAETDEVEETAPASEAGDTDTEEHDAPTPRSNAQKRIQELLAENKRLKQQQPAPKVEAPKTDTSKPETKVEEAKRPVPGDFETWADFQKADADFLQKQIDNRVKDAVERDRQEREQQATAQKQKEQMEQAKTAWDKEVAKTEKRHPDFKQKVFETIEEDGKKFQVLRATVPMNPTLDDFIPKSPVGGELLYHLATLPAEEAEAIRAMQGYDALRFAIHLETKLTEAIDTPPKKQTLRPPRQVNGSGVAPVQKTAEEVFYGSD